MFKKKDKDDFFDDGQTVADMNVDGMPWYRGKKDVSFDDTELYLSKEEKMAFMGGVLKATMLVVGVFALSYALFLLFATKIWFR